MCVLFPLPPWNGHPEWLRNSAPLLHGRPSHQINPELPRPRAELSEMGLHFKGRWDSWGVAQFCLPSGGERTGWIGVLLGGFQLHTSILLQERQVKCSVLPLHVYMVPQERPLGPGPCSFCQSKNNPRGKVQTKGVLSNSVLMSRKEHPIKWATSIERTCDLTFALRKGSCDGVGGEYSCFMCCAVRSYLPFLR